MQGGTTVRAVRIILSVALRNFKKSLWNYVVFVIRKTLELNLSKWVRRPTTDKPILETRTRKVDVGSPPITLKTGESLSP